MDKPFRRTKVTTFSQGVKKVLFDEYFNETRTLNIFAGHPNTSSPSNLHATTK